MARIFLSHSSRDNDEAAELKAWLDGQGFAPAFLDFDKHGGIPAGADWERALYEQIQRCQALLILQTPNWSASRWCFAEFTQARALGKPIFQVVQSDEAAAEKPIAADLQRLDLRNDRPGGLRQLRHELERIALQDQGGFPWPPLAEPSRPPFPGLMVFEAEDAPVFFGRDNDWRAVIERLNTRRVQGGSRLLVIQGSSGSGKSSLLRAGVLPRLRRAGRQWLVLPVLRPQARPLENLAQTLALALQRPEAWRELHHHLLSTTELPALVSLFSGWAADLRQAAASPEAQLLLPIDQAEELFTVADAAERQRFVAVLAAALQPPQPFQAVITIRADAMDSLQCLPELGNSMDTLPLGPLSIDRYREIIEGPARVAGLKVEPAFVERAIHDTATEDALPLLAFALRQLHDRYGADGVLSLSDYQSLGDPVAGLSPLENSVKQAADGMLQAQRPAEASLKALRQAFVPAMVRVGEQGGYARRAAIWDALPEAARPLLEALVAARLLVRRQSEGQGSTVEVAHEALLRVWPLLRGWLDDSRDFLLGSQQLEQDLAQWQAASPADKAQALLSGLKLARGRAWLADRGDQLRPELRRFIQASHQHAVRQRRLVLGGLTGGLAMVSVALLLAWGQLVRAQRERGTALAATAELKAPITPADSLFDALAAAGFSRFGLLQPEAVALPEPASRAMIDGWQRNRERNRLSGHQGLVRSVAYSFDGARIVSAGDDGTVRQWDAKGGGAIGEPLQSHQGQVRKAAYSPAGNRIVSAGDDGTVRQWESKSGRAIGEPMLGHEGLVRSALYSAKGNWIVSAGDDGTVRQWDAMSGRAIGKPLRGHQGGVRTAAYSADASRIVSAGIDGTVRQWDTESGRAIGEPLRGHEGGVRTATYSGDASRIVSAGEDGTVRQWESKSGRPIGEPLKGHQGLVRSAAYSADGRLIVSGGVDGTVRQWDAKSGRAIGEPLLGHQGGVFSPAYSPDGNRIVSAGDDGTVRLWDSKTNLVMAVQLRGHKDGVSTAAYSPDGYRIVSAGDDGTVRQWEARSGQAIGKPLTGHQGGVRSAAYSADGRFIVSSGLDGTVRRWDAKSGQPIGAPLRGQQGQVRAVGFNFDATRIVSAGDDAAVWQWNAKSGQPIGEPLRGHRGQIRTVAYSSDGNRIVSAGEDGTVRQWNSTTGQAIGKPLRGHKGGVRTAWYSLDGRRIVSAGEDGTVRQWDSNNGQAIGEPLRGHQGGVRSARYSPNGSRIVSAGEDGSLRQWDTKSARAIGEPLLGHQGQVRTVAFNSEGSRIVSAGIDGTVRQWLPAWSDPIPLTCRSLHDHQNLVSPMNELQQEAKQTCERWGRR